MGDPQGSHCSLVGHRWIIAPEFGPVAEICTTCDLVRRSDPAWIAARRAVVQIDVETKRDPPQRIVVRQDEEAPALFRGWIFAGLVIATVGVIGFVLWLAVP